MEKQEQTKTSTNQPPEAAAQPAAETPELAGKYIGELLSQAENAYTMYRQAQKEVSKGYKRQEQQMEKTFRGAEQRANTTCEKALEKALKNREQAEQEAEDVFRKAVEKVRDEYRRSVGEALKVRDEAIEEAWQKCTEDRAQAWGIFQGEKSS